MKLVIQRVTRASVTVDNCVVGQIGHGLLVLVGIHKDDTPAHVEFLAAKCAQLRIFADADNKMNLSCLDVKGSVLAVSQFTLLADCDKGRRPNFTEAAPSDKGKGLYEYFVKMVQAQGLKVETGVFGARMAVVLVNDGPVTIVIEKN